MIKVGIIGGSGLDDPNILKDAKEIFNRNPIWIADFCSDLWNHRRGRCRDYSQTRKRSLNISEQSKFQG